MELSSDNFRTTIIVTFCDDEFSIRTRLKSGSDTIAVSLRSIAFTYSSSDSASKSSFECIAAANEKINRALAASAAALGCEVTLEDAPGYMPLNNDPNLAQVMAEAMRQVAGQDSVIFVDTWSKGSTDMGDVSAIMPAVHPHCNGSRGKGHGADYYIEDRRMACLLPAQCLAATAGLLLEDGAAAARRVVENARPRFPSKEAYLAAIDRFDMAKDAVIYNDDGTVTLDCSKPTR